MPRARSKEDLIKASNEQYQKLNDLINSLSEKELNTEFDFSDDPKKTERHWNRDKTCETYTFISTSGTNFY